MIEIYEHENRYYILEIKDYKIEGIEFQMYRYFNPQGMQWTLWSHTKENPSIYLSYPDTSEALNHLLLAAEL